MSQSRRERERSRALPVSVAKSVSSCASWTLPFWGAWPRTAAGRGRTEERRERHNITIVTELGRLPLRKWRWTLWTRTVQDTWGLHEHILGPESKHGTTLHTSVVCALFIQGRAHPATPTHFCVVCFPLQWRSWVSATETVWPPKPNVLSSSLHKVCWSLLQLLNI